MTKIRVLVAEDHETVRQGLKLLIDGEADMEVVGEAGDGRAAIDRARELQPHVAVVDISMPEMNGLAATRHIHACAPDTAVVALTRHADIGYVHELLRAGARGYVLKQSPSGELLAAIRATSVGRQYLDSALEPLVSGGIARARRPVPPAPRISTREVDVLRMMAAGHSNKEIATTLDVSVKTVEVHKANAMRKLGLHGRIDVVRYALLQGWLRDG